MQKGTFFNQINTAVENNEAKSVAEALNSLVAKGLSFVDVYAYLFLEKYKPKDLYELLKAEGVNCASVFNMTNFNYKNDNILEELKDNAKRQLYNCAEMNCGLYMPVPTVRQPQLNEGERLECRQKFIQHIFDIVELAKPYGIKVVIENFSDTTTPCAKIEDITYLLEQIPEVGYVLDTGNYWFSGTDILKATKAFAKRTQHIHLKDIIPGENGSINICNRCCDSVSIGKGTVPFRDIFDILNKSGYNSTASIEINSLGNMIVKISESLEYLSGMNV